ncbi:MAG: [FeFe] hydrogenase H-cluster radical SAM maturase HydG, partial [Treponema sp.]|nr:[FeFe] hydrogenase H-cluster radical SAM maturase HydG [Treponema sp.]
MYDPKSEKAEDFISHEEILDTLRYADSVKDNIAVVDGILEKARETKGLTHREASVLLACDNQDKVNEIFDLAFDIKQQFYGNRIVLFAPLYLSNYCVNGCLYCPYHYSSDIARKKLTQDEIRAEIIALQNIGHKRLAIEAGEDPVNNPIEYILESIDTIYSVKHKNGSIRRVNVNIAATTVENYRKLSDAGIGTYILFQETYDKAGYEHLHPKGPKHNYAYHTEAMDRAMRGDIDDVGIGVLFGLENYTYEFAGLLMHAEHLESVFGVGPHTISVPRVQPAQGVDPNSFNGGISDGLFEKLTACIRIAVPYTGMIISTREGKSVREKLLRVGVSQISGGSCTSVGGYVEKPEEDTRQFEVADTRTLDDVIKWLIDAKYVPSFCTACYREGRTGDRFMALCKSKQILNCCHPNALMTLKEYLVDYASPQT